MHRLAEDLAEGRAYLDSSDEELTSVDEKFPHLAKAETDVADVDTNVAETEAGPSANSRAIEPMIRQKHLPPLGWEDIYAIFDSWVTEDKIEEPRSHRTVQCCYALWKRSLPFRKASQHTNCDQCVDYQHWCKQYPLGTPERKLATHFFLRHIADMMQDPAFTEGLNTLQTNA